MLPFKKANTAVSFILLAVIVALAVLYNTGVTKNVVNAAYNDRAILQHLNAQLIEKFTESDSTDRWSEIIEEYPETVIVIENENNEVVVKSEGRNWNTIDVKVQTPFDYEGSAYVVKSSVRLLRYYVDEGRGLVLFVIVELLIGFAAITALFLALYNIIIRPFRNLYKAIEEYDKTGKLKKVKIRGYAGNVYGRFVSLTENLENRQETERRIIASISHDIKTPLTSIMGYAEQLQKGKLSEERQSRYLKTVYAKSVDITALIKEFDDYLNLNTRQDITTEDVTLQEIYDNVIEEYADEFENKGISFSAFISGDRNALLRLDMSKSRRVLSNVFSNCVKHLTGEKKLVEVRFSSDKEKIYITVDDSGEGVNEDKLELIFEPLYTSDKGRKVAGLGLAICREITELHNGKIYAQPSHLGGLRVCIELDREDKKHNR